ncbi:hypothetical protein AC579_3227 [Pseudocercospora musae]|uniref:NADH:flavin oxidoreductase/NADH oxidase N-terminal domain-containing protein n=1 Tax=Pseudocercospora musae TaxID=113226 RepID=A0A139ISK0_9PEZI|nr:hypothetical protein AC579_3227 [Pseudocercospora musae]
MEYDKAAAPGSPQAKAYPHPRQCAFSGRTAKNGFLKAPMTERLCKWNAAGEDISARRFPTNEHDHLYETWAKGEIGVIVAGNFMPSTTPWRHLGIQFCRTTMMAESKHSKRASEKAKVNGSLFIAQLSHPGRQGSAAPNPNPVSASDVQLKIKWAGNCTNLRTDEYGGSLENRSRIIFEIIEEIHRRVDNPKLIVCVKINSVELQPGGPTPEDCRDLCVKLEEARLDFIDLSGGTSEGRAFEHKKESTNNYFIEFAELIRPLLQKTKPYMTGGFRTASGMVRAIEDGATDGIGIGRPLGAEPFLCKEILEGKVTGAIENFMHLPKNTRATGSQPATSNRSRRRDDIRLE